MIGSNVDKDDFIANAEILGRWAENQKDLAEDIKITKLFQEAPFLKEFAILFSIQSDFGDSFETMEVESIEFDYKALQESYINGCDIERFGLPALKKVVSDIGKPLEEVTSDEFFMYAKDFSINHSGVLEGLIESCVRLGGENLSRYDRSDYVNEESSVFSRAAVMMNLPILSEVLESLIASDPELAIKLSESLIASDGIKEKIGENVSSLVRGCSVANAMMK